MAGTRTCQEQDDGQYHEDDRTSGTPEAGAAFPLPYWHEGDHHRLVMFRQAQLGKSLASKCNLAPFGGVR
jgi:hypothetical protein